MLASTVGIPHLQGWVARGCAGLWPEPPVGDEAEGELELVETPVEDGELRARDVGVAAVDPGQRAVEIPGLVDGEERPEGQAQAGARVDGDRVGGGDGARVPVDGDRQVDPEPGRA